VFGHRRQHCGEFGRENGKPVLVAEEIDGAVGEAREPEFEASFDKI
jgi:hypothetical protein